MLEACRVVTMTDHTAHCKEVMCKQRYLALQTGDLFGRIAQMVMITAWGERSQGHHSKPRLRYCFRVKFGDTHAAKRFMRTTIDNTVEVRSFSKESFDIPADQFCVQVYIADRSRTYVTRDNLLEPMLLELLVSSGRPGSTVEDPDMMRHLTAIPVAASGKCAQCHDSPDVLKTCGACHIVGYCSKTCQREHWAVHSLTCRPAPNNHLRGRST